AIVGHGVEIEILRHYHHVAVALGDEIGGLPRRHAAQPDQGTGEGDRVGGQQRYLAGRAEHAHAEAATGRDAELDLVEQAEPDLRVGKDHLHVTARQVLEQLDVDVVAADRPRQHAAHTLHVAFGVAAIDLLL